MQIDRFLVINVNGNKRKLLKIRERRGKNFSQISAYLGDGFGGTDTSRLGAYKYSIHPPRQGSDESVIHMRAVKKGSKPDGDWFENRHYTRALSKKNMFAHVFSARYQTLSADHNGVSEGENIVVLPDEFDSNKGVLTLGVYIGAKGSCFNVPSDEHLRMVRIETEHTSYVILYMVEKVGYTLKFSQNILTATLPDEQVGDPAEKKIYEQIKQGSTPEFCVNQFVVHHFDLFRDYWRVWVRQADALHASGEMPYEMFAWVRAHAAGMIAVIDSAEKSRILDGKQGRYLRA